ncbi:MAG TPA: hypothetical protein PLP19_12750 [bacterium]|nr:hypothetical protein [bacterium]HPN44354.1 hypothetical protein [bacterium]
MGLFTPKWQSNNPEKRKEWVASANPEDPKNREILYELAKQDQEAAVRLAVTEKLADQSLLAWIANNDTMLDIRKAAIKRITDNSLLATLIKNSPESAVRKAAINKLSDQLLLAEVIKSEQDSKLRKTAVSRLTDPALLAEVAKNDRDYLVRMAAFSKLGLETSQEALADVIINDRDWQQRVDALEKLTNPELLGMLVQYMVDHLDINTAEILKILYRKETLRPEDKHTILQLVGKQVRGHIDIDRQKNHHFDYTNLCSTHTDKGEHKDFPAENFKL